MTTAEIADEVQTADEPRSTDRWIGWVLALLVALPIVVALVGALQDDWLPTGDIAQTELNVRAIPSHPPTIGVAGRFGPFDNQHSHPGPSMAYLLTPVYRLLGSSAASLLIACAVLHIVALCGSVLVARRIGGVSLAVATTVAILLLERSLGGDWFVSPWNPWMPVTAYLLCLMCVFGVLLRHWALAPLAVLAGTHAAQTHASYVVLVHGVIGAALVATAVRLVRWWKAGLRDEVRRAVRWLAASAAVGFVMWLPPLYDQLRGTRNMSWLARYFATKCYTETSGVRVCQEPVGLGPAARAMASELNAAGAWVTGDFHNPATYTPSIIGLLVTVVGISAAGWFSWTRRDRASLTGLGLVGLLAVLAFASTSRILGDFYDYVIRWSWPTAAFCAAVVVWTLWRAASASVEASRVQTVRLASYGVTGLVLLGAVISTAGAEASYPQESKLLVGLSDQLDGLSRDDSYLLRWHDPAGLGGIGFGLLLELEQQGVHAGTDDWTRFAVLPHRVLTEAEADQVMYIVVGESNIAAFAERPGAMQVSAFDPRTPEQVVESDAARATIEARLVELDRQDLLDRIDGQFGNAALIAASAELPDDVNEAISTYTDLRLPAAIFVEPVGGEPFLGG